MPYDKETPVYESDSGSGRKKSQDIGVQGALHQVDLFIQNGERVFQPCTAENIAWETARQGTPGKLTFKVIEDAALDFAEGNTVKLTHNGNNIFFGYIFSQKRNKDNEVAVTAYDQLRYLKNKNIYSFTNETASNVIRALAADFNLKVGEIEDTEYVIPRYRGSNETLFDIIQFTLDHTVLYGNPDPKTKLKKIYVLYDDFGALTLKHIEKLQVDILIDAETAGDFDYESSIDKETYNKIKFYYDNAETKKRETYYAYDSDTIARWGVLQLTESVNPKQTKNPVDKITKLLKAHNHIFRSLSVKDALGDERVRAGSMVYVRLNLGGVRLGADADADGRITVVPMLVESAKHKFLNNEYTMDLVLRGNIIQ